MQTFTLAMCQLLSSKVPGFEGHWWWVLDMDTQENILLCIDGVLSRPERDCRNLKRICPAWTAEDLLKNLVKMQGISMSQISDLRFKISEFLVFCPYYAYRKIEEYLWDCLR